jgi:TM2 domain-containing membrane protein YozV
MATFSTPFVVNMNDQQRAAFQAQMARTQKDEVLGVLLAVFLGTFGAHHFYLRRTGMGICYCFLSVTGFSTIAGFIEAFFMPERVRRFNAEQAFAIASNLGIIAGDTAATTPPALTTQVKCPGCGTLTSSSLNFCAQCGKPLAS